MNIRQKLTLLFLALSFTILAICFIIILYTQSNYREEQFKERLSLKAISIESSLAEQGVFTIEQLRTIQRSSAQLFREQIFIADQAGNLIFSSPSSPPRFDADSSLIKKAGEKSFHSFLWKQFECFALLSNQPQGKIQIIVAGYDQYGFNKVNNLRKLLSVLLIAGLFVSFVVGWFYAGRALSPVNRIINQVNAITIGNLDARLDEGKGKDELDRLSITFNQLLDRIQAAFEAQKNFVANASHELRTPLTIVSGRLELALIKSSDEQAYRDAIREVLADIRQLNQICNSLLILAQSNSNTEKIKFVPFRIDELIWQVRSEFLKMNNGALIEVEFVRTPEDDADLTISGNENLIRTAVINLIDNACKFSWNNSVKIGIDFNGEIIQLNFTDEGPGIEDEELPKLTQPFFRGRKDTEKSGYGLGLPMAENIIGLHGGQLRISSTPGSGSTFSVILPRSIKQSHSATVD